MPPITATTDIARSADQVYAYTTDPSRFTEWQQGVVSGRTEPATAGSPALCITTRKIGFAKRANTSEITRDDPPRQWRTQGLDGSIRANVDVLVTALDEQRSRVEITVEFEGHGVGKLLVPLVVQPQARKEMPANLAALKSRMENGS